MEFIFKGVRTDNNEAVVGYYYKINGVSYILPLSAETLSDNYRVYTESVKLTEETKLFIKELND
jgi:hypothetical protein